MTPEATPSRPTVVARHVLVPPDGSELALHAVPTARAPAQRFDAERVVTPPTEPAGTATMATTPVVRAAHGPAGRRWRP